MKKIIIPVLLLCLLLTACVQGSPREQLQNMQQTTAASTTSSSMTVVMTTVPTTAPTTIPTTAPTTVPPTIVTTPTTAGMSPKKVSIFDYQQYLSYIESSDLPKFFVTYDALSPIGEFRGFSIQQRYVEDGSYEWYSYSFENHTGYRFGVFVVHNQEQDLTAKEYVFGLSGDLRKIDKTSSNAMYYLQDGVTYKYNMYGLLSYIEWTYNDTTYKLHGEAMMFDFPYEGIPAFVANLLHTDTVEAAMQTFEASMEAAAVK